MRFFVGWQSSSITWLTGQRCVIRSQEVGGSKFACIQTGYFREVALALMRERPFGGWLWTLNMAGLWEGGVPMRSMGCTGWGFKKVS